MLACQVSLSRNLFQAQPSCWVLPCKPEMSASAVVLYIDSINSTCLRKHQSQSLKGASLAFAAGRSLSYDLLEWLFLWEATNSALQDNRYLTCPKCQARLHTNIDGIRVFGVEPAGDDPQVLSDASWLVAGTDAVHPI